MLFPSRVAIDANTRNYLVNLLLPTTLTCWDLYAHLKMAHWNLKGPTFLPIHELFDELGTNINGSADKFAERAITLGAQVFFDGNELQAASLLPPYGRVRSVTDHLMNIINDFQLLDTHLRSRIDETGPLDMTTQNMYIDFSESLEKQIWFLQAHLD